MWRNPEHGRAPPSAIPVGAFTHGNGPSVERGVLNGDDIQLGRKRRHARLSQSESQGSGAEEECWGSYGRSPVLEGMAWRSSNSNGTLSSSPRSPRGSLTFRCKRPSSQQQDQEHPPHPVSTVKASGTPHRQASRGRNRTSSETEQGGKGSRGPTHRKRGFSESESKPKRDKYDTFPHSGNGRDMMLPDVFSLFFSFFSFVPVCLHFGFAFFVLSILFYILCFDYFIFVWICWFMVV